MSAEKTVTEPTGTAERALAHDALLADWLTRVSVLHAETWNLLGDHRISGPLEAVKRRLIGHRKAVTKALANPVVSEDDHDA